MSVNEQKRIVIKVGSGLLVSEEDLNVRYAFLFGLLEDIASLRAKGHEVVLVSSGAAAVGLKAMGVRPSEAGVADKQAAAACGQPLLMAAYKAVASEFDLSIAQVLLTSDDMENRRRFLNTKNTLDRLLDRGLLPIVNENDTVTTEEIRVGDNDRLAAKVAQMIQAQAFIMLTGVEGLYDRNPDDEDARFVEEVSDVSEYIEATKSKSALGSGGMLTKMMAANMAQNGGVETYIASGILERPVTSVLENERRYTRCTAHGDPASAWRVWLADRLNMAGSITLSKDGAKAVREGKIGVRAEDIQSVHGEWAKGDVLHVYDEDGEECARGLTNYSSNEVVLLAKRTGRAVEEVLGYHSNADVIDAGNLVILEEHHLPWAVPEEEATAIEV
ncbi:glutamate 5-kinase [Parvularcula maris]|uniref:Glutamate 5-kinase n=1 Tax=Parvularcula maris TaxID=2965077 RepID=A0A9X2LB54_9PROT|nr:glutamate 5-kinase [Parvularcula maris]MCQ8186454.1 glutamate 5-kinase [Parvularcula maris]